MGTSGKFRRTRQGFTLVELLAVIVIIGILAGLITAAAINARAMVKRTVVLSEIGQLDLALKRYKTEFGEYPPDFTGLNEDDIPVDTPGEAAAKVVLDRHLKKRFPKFRGGWNAAAAEIFTNYGVDATRLDSASALAFWLGGLPEVAPALPLGDNSPGLPAGFHEDPTNPFKPGLPRSQPLFEFSDDKERYTYTNPTDNVLRCYYVPSGIEAAPYVYFRPQRAPAGEHTYWFVERNPLNTNQYVAAVRTWPPVSPVPPSVLSLGRAVPYLETATPTEIGWHAEETYQIVTSGMDGLFGARGTPAVQFLPAGPPIPPTPTNYLYPVTETGLNFAEDEYDNLTSVFEGKLEDAVK